MQTRIQALMAGWTRENKAKLYIKMQRLGIMQGGILSTIDENIALFEYLTGELNHDCPKT